MKSIQSCSLWVFQLLLLCMLFACGRLHTIDPQPSELPVYTPFLYSERIDNQSELVWGSLNQGGINEPLGIPAKKYFLYGAVDQMDSLVRIEEIPQDQFRFRLNELEPGKVYYFQLQAWVSDSNSQLSAIISLTAGRSEEKQLLSSIEGIESGFGSWSANNGSVSFQLIQDGKAHIAISSWDRDAFQIISEGKDPSWNLQNQFIAFQTLEDTINSLEVNAIRTINPNNSFSLESTFGGDSYYQQASWSPKGDWITYISNSPGPDNWGIYIYNPEEGFLPRLVSNATASSMLNHSLPIGRPIWSADEMEIIFEEFALKRPEADSTYWVRDIYGTSPLTGDRAAYMVSPWDDFGPTYSPDGRTLAFLSNRSGKVEIWLLDIQDRSLQQLSGESTLSPAANINKLDWSPNGQYILYTARQTGDLHGVCRIKVPN